MAVTIFFSIFANANSDSMLMLGIMKCSVTENKLVIVADGRPTNYTGFNDGIMKGDVLYVNYKLFTLTGVEFVAVSLFKSGNDINYLNHLHSLSEKSSWPREPWMFNVADAFEANKDMLRTRSESETLILRRYYKNDWEGVYAKTSIHDFSSQITTLDCRHKKDVYEQYVDYIISTDGGAHVPPTDSSFNAFEKQTELMRGQETE
jgi:hypothetical protein